VRLTIERLRTLVLVAGGLLVVALVAVLAIGRWKSHFNLKEIPKRLGINIQQEANGVTYTQAHGGHTLFKIHASKVVQLKQGGRALLHDVQIELYGVDGNRVDRIAGDEFEYDQKNGTATAAGPVEITLMRPGEAPAVAPKATPDRAPKATPLANVALTASQGEIRVKTSGLTFDQKSGVATTAKRVEFAIAQGTGSSIGATFDSDKGQLVLDHAVELDIKRGTDKVLLHAQHAEFERASLLCRMHGAEASFRGGEASAGDANLLFRQDGSAVRLDASNGFSMTTATSAHVAAPRGSLEFNEHNQPRHGRMEGGATLDSSSDNRQVHGAAPSADLEFTAQGLLHHAHLEKGVILHSDETSAAGEEPLKASRDWRSPVADLDFREASRGQVELASVTGTGGVLITGQTQRGTGPVTPSRMAADQVVTTFGDGQVLTTAVGTGHASLQQTTAAGAKQTTSGDRIEASFAPPSARVSKERTKGRAGPAPTAGSPAATQIKSAIVDGDVVLVQEPAIKPGTEPPATLRATAGRAVYEGSGEWLHLMGNPRVEDGGLQLTADKLDVSQGSGDAFAHGNVKATWVGRPAGKSGEQTTRAGGGSGEGISTFGGQGPAHVIAAEAQLHQATGEATFRGQARLWQQANSITAPVIVLDRTRQTLVAKSVSSVEPVRVVMLSAGGFDPSKTGRAGSSTPSTEDLGTKGHEARPSVVRVWGGDLKYSDAERKAVMHGGAAGSVNAETNSATSTSNELELVLLPPGNHAGKDGGPAQVDSMTASGHVVVSSQGRRGTGDRLVYSSETDEYVLTGSASNPPRMTDPGRGTVAGASLIFNSRDDSVTIEGGGRKTLTETIAPK
jgi:lipopolysaccharide export system protein LptA